MNIELFEQKQKAKHYKQTISSFPSYLTTVLKSFSMSEPSRFLFYYIEY